MVDKMNSIPVLQSYVDRIAFLGEKLRVELDLRKMEAEWEIDRLRAEIQRREEMLHSRRR